MNNRVQYFADTKIRVRGSELFTVDPNVTNEGQLSPTGSIANYAYNLPFLGHTFPVRSIRAFVDDMLYPPQGTAATVALITLRKADGTFLLNDVPVALFADAQPPGLQDRPLLFDGDFFPDPKMSFVKWTTAGLTGTLRLQFNYG